ncbi:flagellar assembly protein FliW [Amphibacillus cookii]|uniref:flagellar assembly protein FliW n=1 Tax=Amphibacillus cookii TaxID=767787 RepID=UPI0019593F02|nr:flagellar assembly protein FliW [Amphibacillus cookii]MBM7540025.1 flagellar assembly factor FliW [Amphibacillus cookii]
MKIQTKYFGEVEINEQHIMTFPNGLPGFQNQKQFILMDLPDNPVFQILQSIEQETVAFVLASPYQFYQDYHIDLDDSILEQLSITRPEDVRVYGILTLNDDFEKSTINLQAPIILNDKKHLAKQYITNDPNYATRAPIVPVGKQGV